jgi:hypothetical protein
MKSVSAIPLFGLIDDAFNAIVADDKGNAKTVREWIYENPHVIRLETTASSRDLGKYMLMVDRGFKEDVDDYIDNLFEQVPETGDANATFKKPQRGGNTFQKKNPNKIENYLNKLEKRIEDDFLSFYDEDEISASTTPPPRPKRLTISYAQAAKRLSFQNDKSTTQETTESTMATTMSTLTQSSLNEAMEKLRQENDRSISKLREEMNQKIQSMEESIASAVINAIRATPSVVHMETESVATSVQESTQDTTTTIKTITDKFDALASMVLNLSERVAELAEKQETNQNKRNRPPESPMRQPSNANASPHGKSPPTKQQRGVAPTPPTTPPPNGYPKAGTREGK